MLGDVNVIDYERLRLPPEMVADLPAGARRFVQGSEGYVATVKRGVTVLRRRRPARGRVSWYGAVPDAEEPGRDLLDDVLVVRAGSSRRGAWNTRSVKPRASDRAMKSWNCEKLVSVVPARSRSCRCGRPSWDHGRSRRTPAPASVWARTAASSSSAESGAPTARPGDPAGGRDDGERALSGRGDRAERGLLDAAGDHARAVDRVVLPAVRHGRLPQQPIEHADELIEPGSELSGTQRRGPEHGRVPSHSAGTDAENEATLRHVIERHRLLRQIHGMTDVR